MRPYEEKYVNECYKAMQEEHDACGIGLVVNIDGKKEYRTLDDALSIVEKLEHRAGKDATGEVGDGVGILVQVSHKFFKNAAKEAGIEKYEIYCTTEENIEVETEEQRRIRELEDALLLQADNELGGIL